MTLASCSVYFTSKYNKNKALCTNDASVSPWLIFLYQIQFPPILNICITNDTNLQQFLITSSHHKYCHTDVCTKDTLSDVLNMKSYKSYFQLPFTLQTPNWIPDWWSVPIELLKLIKGSRLQVVCTTLKSWQVRRLTGNALGIFFGVPGVAGMAWGWVWFWSSIISMICLVVSLVSSWLTWTVLDSADTFLVRSCTALEK